MPRKKKEESIKSFIHIETINDEEFKVKMGGDGEKLVTTVASVLLDPNNEVGKMLNMGFMLATLEAKRRVLSTDIEEEDLLSKLFMNKMYEA
jgi:hypothetical protein